MVCSVSQLCLLDLYISQDKATFNAGLPILDSCLLLVWTLLGVQGAADKIICYKRYMIILHYNIVENRKIQITPKKTANVLMCVCPQSHIYHIVCIVCVIFI